MRTSKVELLDMDFTVTWDYYPAVKGTFYEPPEDEEFWIENLEYNAEVAEELGFKPEDFDDYSFLKELFKELKKELEDEKELNDDYYAQADADYYAQCRCEDYYAQCRCEDY